MPTRNKSEKPHLPEDEQLTAALKDAVPNLGLEEFMSLCRACMEDPETPKGAIKYLAQTAIELAAKLADAGQHLAAVMILVESGCSMAVVVKSVMKAYAAHDENDPVRVLIARELRTFRL